jgi:hypothetical protein
MASPSQSLTHLGHHFEKVTVNEGARAHLGNVYGDIHNHVHHGEGKEPVGRASLLAQI